MIIRQPILALAMLATASLPAMADPVKVNVSKFIRAETDTYLAKTFAAAGVGQLSHSRNPTSIDAQPIIRMNMDTLYSQGVFDLAAGPLSVTIPPVEDGRYVAVQPVSEDHFTNEVLHDGTHVLTQESVGTRYVALLVRVFADPTDSADLDKAHAIQDAIIATQPATGSFEIPEWDKETLDKTRQALLAVGDLGLDGLGIPMGAPDAVDPVAHLLATAAGWGLNPPSEAQYLFGVPEQNDGSIVQTMQICDVPVDGFWSITVYNADGFMEQNDLNRYSVNNVTADRNTDGTVTIQFGGCTAEVPNCIPITPGWNYVMRLYRPRPEVADGSWIAPEPVPAG